MSLDVVSSMTLLASPSGSSRAKICGCAHVVGPLRRARPAEDGAAGLLAAALEPELPAGLLGEVLHGRAADTVEGEREHRVLEAVDGVVVDALPDGGADREQPFGGREAGGDVGPAGELAASSTTPSASCAMMANSLASTRGSRRARPCSIAFSAEATMRGLRSRTASGSIPCPRMTASASSRMVHWSYRRSMAAPPRPSPDAPAGCAVCWWAALGSNQRPWD